MNDCVGICGGSGYCGKCVMVFPKEVYDELPKGGRRELSLLKKMKVAPK